MATNLAHKAEVENGDVSFALVDSRSNPAWHSFANKVFDADSGDVTISQIMEGAKLSNWNVRLEDVAPAFPNHNFITDSHLVVRDNPYTAGATDVLSVVGSRYKVVQNEELFSFAENLHDGNPDVKVDSAGSLKQGRIVYGSWTLPNELIIDPQGANDKTKLYLIVWTSHDGSVAVQAAITPVRVVCQNTLNLAMKQSKQSFKIRHTQTAEGKIQIARETLGLTLGYFDVFEKEAQALFNAEITDKQFQDIVKTIYPKPAESDSKLAKTKWDNKVVLLNDLYHNSPTNANIKGTKWGAFNALTERLDYFRPTRKSNSESKWASASGFDPIITAEKNKILQVVKSF